MRLERWLRWLFYGTATLLFATGLAWWWLDRTSGTARFYLIAAHGLGAMVFLVAMGAVLVLHVREGWRRRRNRVMGTVTLALMAVLALSAFGLYYVGAEEVRGALSDLHLAAGLVLPLLVAVHVLLGIRSRPNDFD